jgi:hypothetical protein
MPGDLHREGPNAARGSDNEDVLAPRDPSSAQALLRGHRGKRHRRGLLESKTSQLGRELALRHGDVLGEGA